MTTDDVNYILENKKAIEEKIGYRFENHTKLLIQAFTRKSFAQEHDGFEDNEVLEFYGDQLVNTVITKWLYDAYKIPFEKNKNDFFYSKKDEGELSKIRAGHVSKSALAHCIRELGLYEYLLLGNSDKHNEIWLKEKVLCDLFEAIIGAIAVASGWDLDKIIKSCKTMWIPLYSEKETDKETKIKMEQILKNATLDTALQTLNILYLKKFISKSELNCSVSPDEDGNQIWRCECFIKEYEDWDGYNKAGIGEGYTKAEAKQAAAYDMICFMLGKENDLQNSTWICPYCGSPNSSATSVCEVCNEG